MVQIDIVTAQLEARNCTLPTHTSAAAAVRAWQHVRQGTGDQLHGGDVRAPEAMAQPRCTHLSYAQLSSRIDNQGLQIYEKKEFKR